MIFSKSKVLTLQFSENQWLETKIAKLEEDHKMEIAKLREEISKLKNALTANQNLQSSGEYLRIKHSETLKDGWAKYITNFALK